MWKGFVMAKYIGNVVVIEETNLPALFYFKYLAESYDKETKCPPVQYYDEIDKQGLDKTFTMMLEETDSIDKTSESEIRSSIIRKMNTIIQDVTKTVWHGFKYNVIHENVKDEGLAKKQSQVIAKMIKNHEAPYDDIFTKYTVTIIQG